MNQASTSAPVFDPNMRVLEFCHWFLAQKDVRLKVQFEEGIEDIEMSVEVRGFGYITCLHFDKSLLNENKDFMVTSETLQVDDDMVQVEFDLKPFLGVNTLMCDTNYYDTFGKPRLKSFARGNGDDIKKEHAYLMLDHNIGTYFKVLSIEPAQPTPEQIDAKVQRWQEQIDSLRGL